jgi:protein translocase SecG subunit
MAQILPFIQVGLSLLLIAGVLLQRSEAGLGSGFGSEQNYTHYRRRGLEKLLFNCTIILAVLFAISAFASLFISR